MRKSRLLATGKSPQPSKERPDRIEQVEPIPTPPPGDTPKPPQRPRPQTKEGDRK